MINCLFAMSCAGCFSQTTRPACEPGKRDKINTQRIGGGGGVAVRGSVAFNLKQTIAKEMSCFWFKII